MKGDVAEVMKKLTDSPPESSRKRPPDGEPHPWEHFLSNPDAVMGGLHPLLDREIERLTKGGTHGDN